MLQRNEKWKLQAESNTKELPKDLWNVQKYSIVHYYQFSIGNRETRYAFIVFLSIDLQFILIVRCRNNNED